MTICESANTNSNQVNHRRVISKMYSGAAHAVHSAQPLAVQMRIGMSKGGVPNKLDGISAGPTHEPFSSTT